MIWLVFINFQEDYKLCYTILNHLLLASQDGMTSTPDSLADISRGESDNGTTDDDEGRSGTGEDTDDVDEDDEHAYYMLNEDQDVNDNSNDQR